MIPGMLSSDDVTCSDMFRYKPRKGSILWSVTPNQTESMSPFSFPCSLLFRPKAVAAFNRSRKFAKLMPGSLLRPSRTFATILWTTDPAPAPAGSLQATQVRPPKERNLRTTRVAGNAGLNTWLMWPAHSMCGDGKRRVRRLPRAGGHDRPCEPRQHW